MYLGVCSNEEEVYSLPFASPIPGRELYLFGHCLVRKWIVGKDVQTLRLTRRCEETRRLA